MLELRNTAIEFVNDIYSVSLFQMRNMPYELYLRTEHWQHFRAEALKFYQYKCRLCGSKEYLEVHHSNYENIGRETFNDAVLLCDKCHGIYHKDV